MNWQTKKLGEICTIDWGNTRISKKYYMPTGYPAFSATGQDGFVKNYEHEGEGIVLSAIGARCGKCFWADDKWTAIKNTIVIKTKDEEILNLKYLYLLINNEKFWNKSGAAQPFITLTSARNQTIQLPPISIQQQIIEKLGAIRKLQDLNEIGATRTKELFEGLITKIFSSKSGGKYKISKIAEGFQYGLSRAMNTNGGGVPILRINSIEDGTTTDADLKHVEVSEEELSKYKVQLNDILFNRTNSYELVGKTGIFKLSGTFIFASYLIRLRAKGEVLPDYLNYFLNSPMGQAEIRRKAKRAVSQANVNAKELGSISMYVPTKSIQEKAIGQLNLVKQHLQILKAEKEKLVELFECLLSKELQT